MDFPFLLGNDLLTDKYLARCMKFESNCVCKIQIKLPLSEMLPAHCWISSNNSLGLMVIRDTYDYFKFTPKFLNTLDGQTLESKPPKCEHTFDFLKVNKA
jgi:hypothetical protein